MNLKFYKLDRMHSQQIGNKKFKQFIIYMIWVKPQQRGTVTKAPEGAGGPVQSFNFYRKTCSNTIFHFTDLFVSLKTLRFPTIHDTHIQTFSCKICKK